MDVIAKLATFVFAIYVSISCSAAMTNLSYPAGSKVELPCVSRVNNDEVAWTFKHANKTIVETVYSNNKVYEAFREKIGVNRSVPGQSNLIVNNVQPSDSGLYVCTEDNGFGVVLYATLLSVDAAGESFIPTRMTWLIIIVGMIIGLIVIVLIIVCVVRKKICCACERKDSDRVSRAEKGNSKLLKCEREAMFNNSGGEMFELRAKEYDIDRLMQDENFIHQLRENKHITPDEEETIASHETTLLDIICTKSKPEVKEFKQLLRTKYGLKFEN